MLLLLWVVSSGRPSFRSSSQTRTGSAGNRQAQRRGRDFWGPPAQGGALPGSWVLGSSSVSFPASSRVGGLQGSSGTAPQQPRGTGRPRVAPSAPRGSHPRRRSPWSSGVYGALERSECESLQPRTPPWRLESLDKAGGSQESCGKHSARPLPGAWVQSLAGGPGLGEEGPL